MFGALSFAIAPPLGARKEMTARQPGAVPGFRPVGLAAPRVFYCWAFKRTTFSGGGVRIFVSSCPHATLIAEDAKHLGVAVVKRNAPVGVSADPPQAAGDRRPGDTLYYLPSTPPAYPAIGLNLLC